MLELRYVVPDGTHDPVTQPPRLQFRYRYARLDNCGIPFIRYGEWTNWQDVPVVVESKAALVPPGSSGE